MTSRRGFALLAVLWVVVALVTLGVALSTVARQSLGAARNRIDLTEAEWAARGCMEHVRARIGQYLVAPQVDAKGLSGWSALDRLSSASVLKQDACSVTVRAAGSRLDLNAADAGMLGALLLNIGVPSPRRDSMVAALEDWRDADDVARDRGAEREWYERNHRVLPRNGPLADMRELRRVRGFATIDLDSVLGVEPGRIDLNHAPLAVLSSLPGFADEAVSRIAEMRAVHIPVTDLSTFGGQLSPNARQELLANFAELTRVTSPEPDAWIITVSASGGTPAVTAVMEARFVRAGTRAAIVRRRSWSL